MKARKSSFKATPVQAHDDTAASRVQESATATPGHEIGAFEAKTHLSAVLERVSQGESFFITKRGKRIAEIKPVIEIPNRPIPGLWRGRIWIADDFDAPLEDMKEYME